MADGYSNSDIADMLDIRYQTVKTHSHNVVKKLGARNVTQAFMLSLAKGLISVNSDLEKASGR